MLRSDLRKGDFIDVFTWFGKIRMKIIRTNTIEELVASSESGDIVLSLNKLFWRDKHSAQSSRWKFVSKSEEKNIEDVEYVEVVENKIIQKPNLERLLCKM